MDISAIDPHTGGWETQARGYRVYFWKRGNAPPWIPPKSVGYVADEYELRGAKNVQEVIAWAEENVGDDRTYTLYAIVERGDDAGLVQLSGLDPTRSQDNERKAIG